MEAVSAYFPPTPKLIYIYIGDFSHSKDIGADRSRFRSKIRKKFRSNFQNSSGAGSGAGSGGGCGASSGGGSKASSAAGSEQVPELRGHVPEKAKSSGVEGSGHQAVVEVLCLRMRTHDTIKLC